MPPPESLNAIGYVRVSHLLEEQISPDIQRSAIESWAERNKRNVIRWIEDLDMTGRNFARKIMDGIEAIEAGEVKEIIVWKYSRFGRNRTGCAVNLGRINMAGGELQSATEEVDARTAVGKLTRGMLMELAAFESDRTGEQWKEAHSLRRARGLPATGRLRFGYVRRGRMRDPLQKHTTIRNPEDGEERYEIDPVTGPILAELYHRYTAGQGGRELAVWLNDAGITTTRGGAWSNSTVLRVLDSGFGAGLLRVHNPDCNNCSDMSRCPNHVMISGAHSPVITPEEWRTYRRRRKRVADTPPRARVTAYPLSGIIWCGHCGNRMTITAAGATPGYWYRCGRYLQGRGCEARSARRSVTEDAVLSALHGWASYTEAQPALEVARPINPVVDTERLKAAVATLEAAIKRLTVQLAKGLVPEGDYKEAHAELIAERDEAQARLDAAQQPRGQEPHEYVPVVKTMLAEWATLPSTERREMLARAVGAVRVFRQDRQTAWVEIETLWGELLKVDI